MSEELGHEIDELQAELDRAYAKSGDSEMESEFPESSLFGDAKAFAENESSDEGEKRSFDDAEGSDVDMSDSPAKKADETEELSKELKDAGLEESKTPVKDSYKFAEEGEYEFDEAFDYAYDLPSESEDESEEEPLDADVDFRAFEFATEDKAEESSEEEDEEEESQKAYTKFVILEELSEDETAETYADKLEDKEDLFADTKTDAQLFAEELFQSEKLPKANEEFQTEAFEFMQEVANEAEQDTFESEANAHDALEAAKAFEEEGESDEDMEDEEEVPAELSKQEQAAELQQETPMIVG